MGQIIDPKSFLIQQRDKSPSLPALEPSDLIRITELNMDIPLSLVLDEQKCYQHLKQMVSEYNGNAALTNKSPVDFDDLHTRYSEYIEALKSFF